MAFRIDNATLDFEPTVKTPGIAGRAEIRCSELDSWSLAEIRARAERERAQAVARLVKSGAGSLARLFRAAAAPVRAWFAQQRTVAELNALDDRMLRDIGVTRADIEVAVQRLVRGEAEMLAGRPSRAAAAAEDRYAGERPRELTPANRNETKKAA